MSKKRVLVVEDEQALAQIVKLKLESEGVYEVTNAFNGQEALDVLSKNEFDVVLLDLVMPEMNGFDVLEQMQQKKYTVPVIVASNLGQAEDIKRATDLGAKDYYIKSETSLAEIVDHVKKVLK